MVRISLISYIDIGILICTLNNTNEKFIPMSCQLFLSAIYMGYRIGVNDRSIIEAYCMCNNIPLYIVSVDYMSFRYGMKIERVCLESISELEKKVSNT